MASGRGGHKACLRTAARLAVVASIAALLLASMGLFPLRFAAFAVLCTLLANGILISFATQVSEAQYDLLVEATEGGSPQQEHLDPRTCVQGFAMVPITIISVLCLALYKAEADAGAIPGDRGELVATRLVAKNFLRFMGCGVMLDSGTAETVHKGDEKARQGSTSQEDTIFLLHAQFMGAALTAAVAYLLILGLRALLSEAAGQGSCVRSAARSAFGVAVGLLIFAVVDSSPVKPCAAACVVSLLANIAVLLSGEAGVVPSRLREVLEVHSFLVVTLSCLYCLGCVLLERAALTPGVLRHSDVKLRFVGFQLAFSAAVWFAVTLVIRACFKMRSSTLPDQ